MAVINVAPDGQPVYGTDGADTINGSAIGDTIRAGAGDDIVYGNGGDDILIGQGGDDHLYGGPGNDLLRDGPGVDTFDGGGSDPTETGSGVGRFDRVSFYNLDATQGAVADLRTQTIANDGYGNHETMTGIGGLGAGTPWVDHFYGNDADNDLFAGRGDVVSGFGGDDNFQVSGAAVIDGGAGTDSMLLTTGDDFVYDSAGNLIETGTMPAGWNVDLQAGTMVDGFGVHGTVTGIENVSLYVTLPDGQSDVVSHITGDANANVLTGSDFTDVLSGGAGNDTIHGGLGNDTIDGGDGDDYLYGDAGDNIIRGGAGNDFMRDGSGVDSFDGGADNGYDPNSDIGLGDRISFSNADATQGVVADLRTGIISNDGYGNSETMTNVESLGGGTVFADTLYGDDGANLLVGGRGDTLTSFGGDDHFQVSGAPAHIDGGAGTDTLLVVSGGDYVLQNGQVVVEQGMPAGWTIDLQAGTITDGDGYSGTVAGIENVTLGAYPVDGQTDVTSRVSGDDNANILIGSGFTDYLAGRGGDDTYYVAGADEHVIEAAGGGTDTVHSYIDYKLTDNVENLVLEPGAGDIYGMGNDLANTITGNEGANTLDGLIGADTMIGGAGNDTYVVDNRGDQVIEAAGGGIDLVNSYVTYTLGDNVERLQLLGTADTDGTGNALVNLLIGNSGSNVLDGKAGADLMIGGAGNDFYHVDNVGDRVSEAANEGADTVYTSVSFTLPVNVENIVLDAGAGDINATGNAVGNILDGNEGVNTLDGRGGADYMHGGQATTPIMSITPAIRSPKTRMTASTWSTRRSTMPFPTTSNGSSSTGRR